MSEWQRVTYLLPPVGERVLVAYHDKYGEVFVDLCERIDDRGAWGDWNYINSHSGEPQWWAPIPSGLPPLQDFIHGDCGCDACTEATPEQLQAWRDQVTQSQSKGPYPYIICNATHPNYCKREPGGYCAMCSIETHSFDCPSLESGPCDCSQSDASAEQ